MKKFVVPRSSPVPDLDALDDLVLGTALPAPDLEGSLSKVMIGAFAVESIDGRNWGVGTASLTNFQYHLQLQRYPTQMCIWRHINAIPQCREMIASYRAAVLSTDSSAFKPPARKSHSVPANVSWNFEWALSRIVFSAFTLMTSYPGTEQPLMLALCYCSVDCRVMLLLEYMFWCNHLMACPVRVPRTMNFYLRPLW